MSDTPLPPYQQVSWHHYDVTALWQQLEPEDDYFTRQQERTWNRTYDLLDAHRVQLEALFDGLAKIWPPLPGSASETYLSQLRIHIDNITRVSHDASGNALAVSSIADSLMNARTKIEALQQTNQNHGRPRPYTQFQDHTKLNTDAANTMTEADKSTYDYASLLRTPADNKSSVIGHEKPISSFHSVDAQAGDSSSHDGSRTGGGPDSFRTTTSPSHVAVTGTGLPPAAPVLTGHPGPTHLAPATTDPSQRATPPSGSGPGAGVWPTPPRGVFGPYGKQARLGGRIGPGAEREAAWSPGPSRSSGQRNLPGDASTHPANTAAETHGSGHGVIPAGTSGGGSTRRRRQSSGASYTEWEVASGVPPVLKPPPEPTTFDPGPGVWGIDR